MEKVQLSLERFLPELRDLERKKVFTKDEISDIVAQRRSHEVALSKRDVKPVDYLRYIEYEKKLERLRKSRASRLQTTTKKTLSDHSISAHITHLHRLATRRFPSSHALWEAFISHSLTLASAVLISRTISSAIALHPHRVDYWLMASKFESEGDGKGLGGGNTEAARKVCMRGLRFLRGAAGEKEIWREWVRVEVAYVERVRGREAVLGLAKKVGETDEMEVDPEADGEDVEMARSSKVDELMEKTEKEVEEKVLIGSEAILDGMIVRLVLDNALESYSHSVTAHLELISQVRTLPTLLRLSLLEHLYTSLSAHILPETPDYPSALHILATRPLYDIAYDPAAPKTAPAAEGQDDEIKVEGEAFVDAIGLVVDTYWKACKGKKGKGKEKADIKIWEAYCTWLEEMEEKVEDESLTVFLTTNLTTALSLAPSSALLSLLHLRHLLRITAPHSSILTFAHTLSSTFGSSPNPLPVREEVWVVRLSTVVALASHDAIPKIFGEAVRSLPFSGKIWSIQCEWMERVAIENVGDWYERSIKRVLLADALPPVGFESKFEQEMTPRELLPRNYLSYLLSIAPESIPTLIPKLLLSSPTLPLSYLTFVLASVGEGKIFREVLHSRIIEHSEAGPSEWVAFGAELMNNGEMEKSNEVMRRGRRVLQGTQLTMLEREWAAVLDA